MLMVAHEDRPEMVCQVIDEGSIFYFAMPSSPSAIRYFRNDPRPLALRKDCWHPWD